MFGKLFICGTPIGNLEDITLRSLQTLEECDFILAEDTRHSKKLLNRYEIKTPLISYHEHNKIMREDYILELLREGKNLALITDAGMPCISDPGEDLVKLCYENGISVTTVPGATAIITGLILSGFSTRRYIFEGFLPTENTKRDEIINNFKNETRTIILYEAPHRLKKTLLNLHKILGTRKIAIIREITKRFEEVIKLNLDECADFFDGKEIRGEIVLVIEGISETDLKNIEQKKWENLSIEEHVNNYANQGMDKKDAMKLTAKDRGVSKRDIYNALITRGTSGTSGANNSDNSD